MKYENCKPPMGVSVVQHKQISIVNPNRGNQGKIPEKESPGIANLKRYLSSCQTELIPRCQRDNFNEDPSWLQKKLIPRLWKN